MWQALFLVAAGGCATGLETLPEAWLSVPKAVVHISGELGGPGSVQSPIRIDGGTLRNGETVVAGPFEAIDSFDYSAARGEVIFSAKKAGNFDIGLAADDGSKVNWLPADPADEVSVKWAPRGNKVSYVVRTKFGDYVRTLHIPTSAALTVDFPYARVTSLTWEPGAERYTVTYSTPDASDRRELLKYGGEERWISTPPSARLPVSIEPYGPDALILRPNDIRYGEKLPVVLWLSPDPLRWNDARAELIRNARVAVVVASRPVPFEPREWLDLGRVFVVRGSSSVPRGSSGSSGASAEELRGTEELRGAPVVISGDPSIPPGRYRVRNEQVTAAADQVESVAARFIAQRLKGTSPTNGSSR